MAQLGVSIGFEGSEEACREFLWELVHKDEDDEDNPRELDSFESMDELVDYAKSMVENGNWCPRLPGVMGVEEVFDFEDGNICVSAYADDYYESILNIFAHDLDLVYDNPDVTVHIYSYSMELWCGHDNFEYQDGSLVEWSFSQDPGDPLWRHCFISWSGPEEAVQALLADITAVTKDSRGCIPPWKDDVSPWRGKRLNLDHYYYETGRDIRRPIAMGKSRRIISTLMPSTMNQVKKKKQSPQCLTP
jgi:hypothetical protein